MDGVDEVGEVGDVDKVGNMGSIGEVGGIGEVGEIDGIDKVGDVDEADGIDEADGLGGLDEIGESALSGLLYVCSASDGGGLLPPDCTADLLESLSFAENGWFAERWPADVETPRGSGFWIGNDRGC